QGVHTPRSPCFRESSTELLLLTPVGQAFILKQTTQTRTSAIYRAARPRRSGVMTTGAKDVAQLLYAARAGSPEALGQMLEACRCYLLGIADREFDAGLRAKGAPSDLVQETFLEAQRDFAQFQGSTEAELLAWLRRMLLHNLANFIRDYR